MRTLAILRWIRLRSRRLLLAALVIAIPAGCALAWQIRNDLRADNLATRWGYESHERADRWFFITRPLLWTWTRSDNEARFDYASSVFVRQGGACAHEWLDAALLQNPSHGFHLRTDFIALLDLNAEENLRHFVQTALANLDVRDPSIQFDAGFLTELLKSSLAARTARIILDDMPHPGRSRARLLSGLLPLDVESATGDLKSLWMACRETPEEYDRDVPLSRIAAAPHPLEAFHQLHPGQQAAALNDPKIQSSAEQALLEQLADDPREPFRGAAAYCLWDILGDDTRLARMLDIDLGATCHIEQLALLKTAEHHRNSRFMAACRAYGKIRGKPYFHESDWITPEMVLRRPLPPHEEEAQWRQWLAAYPDHPGADDASFWIGRCLEWQGKRTEALEQFADLVVHPRGDGDMMGAIQDRLVLMLDVGTTTDDLRRFLERAPTHPMAKSVRYALAVHLARSHHYDEALRLTANLTADSIAVHSHWFRETQFLLTGFYDQRRRWQTLRTLGPPDRWQNRLALATAWSREDSWRNGYLMLWEGTRCFHYAFTQFSNDAGRNSVIPAGYRSANPLTVSLALLQSVVHDPLTDPSVVERAMMLEISLLADCSTYPECAAMVPLPDFPEDVGKNSALYLSPLSEYDERPKDIIRAEQEPADWYVRQAVQIERTLELRFPESKYLGQAREAIYELTNDTRVLPPMVECRNNRKPPPVDWKQLLDDLTEGLQALRS